MCVEIGVLVVRGNFVAKLSSYLYSAMIILSYVVDSSEC